MHDRLPHQRHPAPQDWEIEPHRRHSVEQAEPLFKAALRILWRQKWAVLLVSMTLFAASIALIVSLPKRYTAYATVMIDPRERGFLSGDRLTPALLGDEAAVASEMEVFRSRDMVRQVVVSLGLTDVEEFTRDLTSNDEATRRREVVEAVSDQIGLANLNESRVIEVSFTALDPVLAARVTNALADRYLATLADRTALIARDTSDWLVGRLAELETDLADLEEQAEKYREETVAQIGIGSTILRQKISETSSAIVAAETTMSRTEARRAEYASALSASGARAALSISDGQGTSELLAREAEARAELQILAARHGPEHALLDRPTEELAALTRLIETAAGERLAQLAAEAELARATARSLEVEMDGLQSRLTRANEREIRQRSLDREVAAAQKVYSTLLTRLRETESVPAAITSAWPISTADAPTKKSSPRRSILAAAALLLSGAAGAGAAFLRENDRTGPRRVGRRVMRQLDLPWVAYVPEERRVRRSPLAELVHLVRSDHHGRFTRPVRHLASEVLVETAGAQGVARVVWVTSVAPRVGNTTVATSLAAAIAERGRRVLLVDANATRPQLHLIADAPASAASDAAPEERHRSLWKGRVMPGGVEGLSVLPLEGRVSALVDTRQLEEVLQDLAESFYLVIVDGEAFEMNRPLVPMPRGVSALIITLPRDLHADALDELRQRLIRARSTILGAVLNRCPAASIPSGP